MIKGIGEIFKNDLKSIKSNPVVFIALIIIICIPSLYTLVNIHAIWDPYDYTSNMKIAIVDNDAGYTVQGVNYNLGNNFTDGLKNNSTDFDWQFVDENTARNGVKDGTYYAAFIIPGDFSQVLLSDISNPKQANIVYVVNEKLSPVSPKLTNATAKSLQAQINAVVYQVRINAVTMQAKTLQAQLNPMGAASLNASSGNTNQITFSTDDNDPSVYPVGITEDALYPVDNYGSAIAPFYLALSLFIGCIIVVAMLSTQVKNGKVYHHVSVYLGKMGLFLIMGIAQAIVIALAALSMNIQTSSTPLLVLTVIYIGICFTVGVYSLTSVFGNLGKLLAIILLVFQIMATGGTFPLETLSPFFQGIHTYLPMTYAIEALRQVIAGVIWSQYWYAIEILTLFPVVLFIFAIVVKDKMDEKAEWIEEKMKNSGLFN